MMSLFNSALCRKLKESVWILLFCFLLSACAETSNKEQPLVLPQDISKDIMSWLYYDRDNMEWSADFKALDTSFQSMSKDDFLYRLTTGNYLPVRMKTNDSSLCYQLYKTDESIDNDIKETIKNKAQLAYQYMQMEGQKLPGFDFVDLDHNRYNPSTTKDKIVVLNCWFIDCQACREEMPALNKIVREVSKRNDIVFLGLAFDKADSLSKFLTKTKFDYAIVPDKEIYLRDILRVAYYPTHIIVNKEGRIVKIIDGGLKEFIHALNKELRK
jgi:peroxiredoxin